MSFIDALGTILVLPFKAVQPRIPQEIKKILIIRLDHIGDLVCATPILENLKRRFPQAQITFLAPASARELLETNPYVDEWIWFDAPWFSRDVKEKARGKNPAAPEATPRYTAGRWRSQTAGATRR